jgi:hypothetical protein
MRIRQRIHCPSKLFQRAFMAARADISGFLKEENDKTKEKSVCNTISTLF